MPYLHGQPFKYQLRREIAELKHESWNERKEHMKTRQSLRFARAKIEALEARVEKMKQNLRATIAEADTDIVPAVVERYKVGFRIAFDDTAVG